jgi:hypothetical protein
MFPDMDWIKLIVWSGILTFCTVQWVCTIICLTRVFQWIGG